MSVFVIAEIGINHNGSMEITKRLIDAAAASGCDAVKFQKRTVETVYTKEELDKPRESPWGTTNREQKNGLEFSKEEYQEIEDYCESKGIHWFASAWDIPSAEFLAQYECDYIKIPSAKITDLPLLDWVATNIPREKVIISTGMSTMDEIRIAARPAEVILHCNSTYPAPNEELNLLAIRSLKLDFPHHAIGYSGHERGIAPSVAAVALGATMVERHFTLDRAMWGTDQAASLEPTGFARMAKDIRAVEVALGDGVKRVFPSEEAARKKLSG